MSWSDSLIGLPYLELGRTPAGVDCWGLVRLAFAAHGVEVPSYVGEYLSPEELAEVAEVIRTGVSDGTWEQVAEAQPMDMLVFRRGPLDAHTAVVVGQGLMLHVDSTAPSRIERYSAPLWRSRLTGIYRHKAFS